MANDISTNPFILDTVTGAVVWPSTLYVDHFEFVQYNASTDTCQITNGAGKVIWEGQGNTTISADRSGHIGTVHGGLYLSQLTNGGQVRVYLGKPS